VTSSIFSSLRFDDPSIEQSFRAHDCMATVPVARFCYLTGCFLWASFGLLDVLLAPDRLGALWALRFGVGLPTLLFAFAATYMGRFQRNLKLVGVAVTLVCGSTIIAMTAILASPVADSYYVGLILVLFCSYSFAQLRFFQAMFSSVALLAAYELVLVFRQPFEVDIFINNSAFVASTIYIGMFTCYKLEEHRRRDYEHKRTIEEQGSHDDLTGLLNRRQLAATFDRATARWAEHGERTAVMLIDVDNFKQINDRLGHDVGDDVLEGIAASIRTVVRDVEAAFRYGGDEFLVLLPGVTAGAAETTARRIGATVTSPAAAASPESAPPVSVSIGVTEVASAHDTPRTVMRLADEALYEAKRQGKGRVVVHARQRAGTGPHVAEFRPRDVATRRSAEPERTRRPPKKRARRR
jgi:diguanylate cyclase (GGDEF)-like protein